MEAHLQKLKLQLTETFAFTADRRLGLLWRLLVCLFLSMIVLGVSQGVLLSLDEQRLPLPETTSGAFYLVIRSAGILGITALCRRFLDRRPWQGIGLPRIWKSIPHLLLGWLVGCVLIALVFAIEYALGWVGIEGNEVASSGWGLALDSLVGGLFLALAVGFTEEVIFRGYVFQSVAEQFPVWFAALITGLLFAAVHGAEGARYFASVMLVSTFLIAARLSARSLWFAIAFHGGWNWMQTAVLGIAHVNTPEYGHALLHLSQTGPELFVGSAPMIEGGLIVIGLLALVLGGAWLHSRRTPNALSWRTRLSATGEPIAAE